MKYFLLNILFISSLCFATTKQEASVGIIDSLKYEIKKTSDLKLKVDLRNKLARAFYIVSYDSIKPQSELALQLATKNNYLKGKLESKINLALFYQLNNKKEFSQKLIDEVLESYESLNDEKEIAHLCLNLGWYYKNTGRLNDSYDFYYRSLKILQQLDDRENLIQCYIGLAEINNKQGQYEESENNFENARLLNLIENNKYLKFRIISGLGLLKENQSQFTEAIQLYKEALEANEDINAPLHKVIIYNNFGNLYRKKADYIQSITYLNKAQEIAYKINNKRYTSIIKNNLANNFYDLKDYDKALKLYKEVTEITKDYDDYAYAISLSNMAVILQDRDPELASEYHDKAHQIFKNLGSESLVMQNLYSRAILKFKTGSKQAAIYLHHESIKLSQNNNDLYFLLGNYINLGSIYNDLNQLDSALYYTSKSYKLAQKLDTRSDIRDAGALLHKIYKKKNNIDSALYYLEESSHLKDSIFNRNKTQELARLEASKKYLNQKEQLERQKQKRLEKDELEFQKGRYQVYLLSVLALILISFIIFFVITIRRNSKMQKIIDKKNKSINLRNEQLKDLHVQKNRLFSVISHDLRGPLNNLKQLIDLFLSKNISQKDFQNWIPKVTGSLDATQNLIDGLLIWVKQSITEHNLKKEKIKLYQEIEKKTKIFYPDFNKKQLTFINDVPQDLEILIDVNTLKLVLRNLISNAIKFSNINSKITISAEETADDHIRICVQDTGVGMSQEQADKLFKNKDIVSSLGTNQEKGAGIGLLLCQQFLQENNGKIWVEKTEIDKGTTICILLPKS